MQDHTFELPVAMLENKLFARVFDHHWSVKRRLIIKNGDELMKAKINLKEEFNFWNGYSRLNHQYCIPNTQVGVEITS